LTSTNRLTGIAIADKNIGALNAPIFFGTLAVSPAYSSIILTGQTVFSPKELCTLPIFV
jgi:hypothetical protein